MTLLRDHDLASALDHTAPAYEAVFAAYLPRNASTPEGCAS
jgi:hypothetical protein